MKRVFAILLAGSLIQLLINAGIRDMRAATFTNHQVLAKSARPAGRTASFRQLSAEAQKKGDEVSGYQWMLEPRVFNRLSSAGQRAALQMTGRVPMKVVTEEARQQIGPFLDLAGDQPLANIRVNNPAMDNDLHTQSESSIAVNGNNIAISFNNVSDSNGLGINGYSISTDGGRSFAQGVIPEPRKSRNLGDGVVAFGANGELYYSSLYLFKKKNKTKSLIGVAKSTDRGLSFSDPVEATGSAGNKVDFQDKEWLAVDSHSASPFKGNIYLSWTTFPRQGGQLLRFSRSTDGGASFDDPIDLPRPADSAAATGTVSAVGPRGELYVLYWNIRRTGGSSIEICQSNDGGRTFGNVKRVAAFFQYGFGSTPLTGGPAGVRTNAFPSVAIDGQGAIYVVFPAKGLTSPSVGDRSNIFFTRSLDGGNTFSSPVQLNDDATTATQSMPSIAVTSNGVIGAKWWDRRNDPGHDVLTDVYMAISNDGGATFSRNFRITDQNWFFGSIDRSVNLTYHGDYDGIAASENNFFLSWSDERNGNPDVYFTTVPLTVNVQDPDFSVVPSKLYDGVVAGQSVSFSISTSSVNDFSQEIEFTASPNIDGLTYSFGSAPVIPGQPAPLTISASAATKPSTYSITVAGNSGSIIRKTSILLSVFEVGRTAGVPVNATETTGFTNIGFRGTAVDSAGNLHICFFDDGGLADGFSYDVCYTQSLDSGRTFSRPIKLFDASAQQPEPEEAELVDPDEESEDGGTFDFGATVYSQDSSNKPAISVDPLGNVYVLVKLTERINDVAFISKLVLYRSTDGGRSFLPPQTALSELSSVANKCQIAYSTMGVDKSGNILIAFLELCPIAAGDNLLVNRVHVVRSTDRGETFSAPQQISADGEEMNGLLLDLPVRIGFDSTGRAFVLYAGGNLQAGPQSRVMLAVAQDGGTFAKAKQLLLAPVDLGFPIELNFSTPDILIDRSDNIYIALLGLDNLPADGFAGDIFLMKSVDGGRTFSSPSNVTNSKNAVTHSLVLTADDHIGLMYVRVDLGSVVYSESLDGGKSFSSAQNLSDRLPNVKSHPEIIANSSGSIFAFWDTTISGSDDVFACKVR